MARSIHTYEVVVRRVVATVVEVEAHHPREAEKIVASGSDPDSIIGFDVIGDETYVETYCTERVDAA